MYKCFITIELIILKAVISIIHAHLNSVLFVTIIIFEITFWFKFQSCVCNGCHNVLMMSTDINSITILTILSLGYGCN